MTDERVLSGATVVAASRDWICVRLATYESQAEADFLTSIYTGRSGKLENTTFAFLAPDGKTLISRAGRGPHQVVGDGRRGPPPGREGRRGPPPERDGRRGPPPPPGGDDEANDMAKMMKGLVAKYTGTKEIAALPQALDFRRALNVAACDNQPLVVVYAKSDATRDTLNKLVSELAWSDTFVGRMQYIVVSDRDDLAVLTKVPSTEGVYFVQPDRFGLEGAVTGATTAKAKSAAVSAMLTKSLATFETFQKSTRDHKRKARRDGVKEWEPEIPVTDPGIPPGGRGPR